MPCSGSGKSLTLDGCSSVLPKINWSQVIYIWVTIFLTTISQLPIVLRLSMIALCFEWSKIGSVWIYLSAEKLCSKISQRNRFEICHKNNILWWFKIKHTRKNWFVVYQCTIASDEHTQVNLAIIKMKTILITQRSHIDFRMVKCN